MHKTLGIIPARGGSKRIPGKNMRELGGKPLVARIIDAASWADSLHRLVVSTDDNEILGLAASFGGPTGALRRPDDISQDHSTPIEYIQHAMGVLEGRGHGPFDSVAVLPPSSPFTTAADIDATIRLLLSSGAGSAVSVMLIDHAIHPLKMKTMSPDGHLQGYLEPENGRMATHELPSIYVRNCSVYATRRDVIDSGRFLSDDCVGYIMPRERSLDINDETDFRFAEFLLSGQGLGMRIPK